MKWTVERTAKDPETTLASAIWLGHLPLTKDFHKMSFWNNNENKTKHRGLNFFNDVRVV